MTATELADRMSRVTGYVDSLTAARTKLAFLLNLMAQQSFSERQLMDARDALVLESSRVLINDILGLHSTHHATLAGQQDSTVMPLALIAEEKDKDQLIRRLVLFLRPDPKMMIEVEKKEADTDPAIPVYQVNIEDGRGGSWCEAFGSEDMLRAFLRGIRVTFAMSDLQKLLPDFDDDGPLQFTEQSSVQHLP